MIKKITTFLYLKLKFYLLSFVNLLIPKNKNIIYIFDRDLKKDNVWTLMKYLSKDNEYAKYKIYYYTKDPLKSFNNVVFISNKYKALKYQLRAKYIFYSYNEITKIKYTKNQIVLNTMHGSPLKNIGYLASNSKFKKMWKLENDFTHVLCMSDFFKDIIMKAFNIPASKCLVLGYPRNDEIYNNYKILNRIIGNSENYNILWMPTWRREIKTGENRESNIEFPILNKSNISSLSKWLKENNVNLLIKPHPFQTELEFLKKKYQNITILKNDYLNTENITIYSILNEVDGLITDYSSIYFDFLLVDKPIGFTIDDFDEYDNKRGFVIDNPLDIMPGEKVKNLNELKQFIKNTINDNDQFIQERHIVNELVNKYNDGDSSKRICKALIK